MLLRPALFRAVRRVSWGGLRDSPGLLSTQIAARHCRPALEAQLHLNIRHVFPGAGSVGAWHVRHLPRPSVGILAGSMRGCVILWVG